jgi:hypothetical protein
LIRAITLMFCMFSKIKGKKSRTHEDQNGRLSGFSCCCGGIIRHIAQDVFAIGVDKVQHQDEKSNLDEVAAFEYQHEIDSN